MDFDKYQNCVVQALYNMSKDFDIKLERTIRDNLIEDVNDEGYMPSIKIPQLVEWCFPDINFVLLLSEDSEELVLPHTLTIGSSKTGFSTRVPDR